MVHCGRDTSITVSCKATSRSATYVWAGTSDANLHPVHAAPAAATNPEHHPQADIPHICQAMLGIQKIQRQGQMVGMVMA